MAQTIPAFLADLPEQITPELLAAKHGIKKTSLYQLIYRIKLAREDLDKELASKPSSSETISLAIKKLKSALLTLPPVHSFGGNSKRKFFERQEAIDWFLGDPPEPINEYLHLKQMPTRKVGRPTKAEQLAKVGVAS